jgi:hypothetical protein
MSVRGRAAPLALAALGLLAAAVLVAGCGETVIDSAKTEAALEENLRGSLHKRISSVECPSDVKVEAGTSFQCTVNLAGGKAETATLRIRNKEADVEVTSLAPKR